MRDNWAICYCARFPNGELFDKKNPFMTANINAKTADEAIAKLQDEFSMCKLTILDQPKHSVMTDHEYEAQIIQPNFGLSDE